MKKLLLYVLVLFPLGVAAIALLVYLVRMSQTVGGDIHVQRLADLRAIDSLDVAFNRSLTQGRAATMGEATDERSKATAEMGDKLDAIDKGPANLHGLSASVDAALATFVDTLELKMGLGYDFEAKNTITSQRLIQSIDAVPDLIAPLVAAATPAEKQHVAELAQHAKTDIVAYGLAQSPSNEPAIRQTFDTLAVIAELQSPAFRDALATLRARADDVIADKQEVVKLQKDILDRPTGPQLQALEQAYNAWHEQQLETSNRYRQYLAAYAGTLLLVLAYLGARLLRSYRELDRANEELSKTNENLEAQVQARTKDLSGALNNLKASQAQLVQSEKMASLGQMVAGVAHEINTPLGYARANTEIVRSSLTEFQQLCTAQTHALGLLTGGGASDQEVADAVTRAQGLADSVNPGELSAELDTLLNDVDHGLTTVADLVKSLKDFSRVDRSRTDLHDIHSCIESALKISNNQLKHRVEVVRRYGKLPEIECAPSQLNQVFLNLVTNAAQAITDKGKIFVQTGTDADGIVIRILDTGCGMPEEVRKHIFEPFYTTKPVGKGTGLGLSIAYRIIEDHGGRIGVRSTPGKGTEFTINLPLRQAPPAAEPEPAKLAA